MVGFAETGAKDPSCAPAADSWSSRLSSTGQRGEVQQQLPTFQGDDLAAAVGINDNGDVVGLSGTCATPDTSALGVHAVLWRNGSVFDLGGLGGVMNNAAIAINNAGQIAGISDPPGDTTTDAVLWHNAALRQGGNRLDLGTLPGDVLSIASDINAKGQVVGALVRCELQLPRFPLGSWRDDGPQQPHSTWLSAVSDRADGINDCGEIAGSAFDPSTGETPGFLGDSCASGANRRRFGRGRSTCPKTSARRFSDDCAFAISQIA